MYRKHGTSHSPFHVGGLHPGSYCNALHMLPILVFLLQASLECLPALLWKRVLVPFALYPERPFALPKKPSLALPVLDYQRTDGSPLVPLCSTKTRILLLPVPVCERLVEYRLLRDSNFLRVSFLLPACDSERGRSFSSRKEQDLQLKRIIELLVKCPQIGRYHCQDGNYT